MKTIREKETGIASQGPNLQATVSQTGSHTHKVQALGPIRRRRPFTRKKAEKYTE
jgi:hypothetical protein